MSNIHVLLPQHFLTIPYTMDQEDEPGRFSLLCFLDKGQETQAKLLLASLWAPQAECSCELLALLLAEWRGDCLAHLLYEPDDAGALFLAEGHGAGQAVELP